MLGFFFFFLGGGGGGGGVALLIDFFTEVWGGGDTRSHPGLNHFLQTCSDGGYTMYLYNKLWKAT